ncbi:Hypothetical predicted protein [Paramuricea clavata]|uniref:DUF6729 domain-containing protein n=1 Tax=Paramuricea clavata TaxID=317549 RepID=A0A7D9J9C8_PARCT|nr:Hypothetical predicted protein [Paramuricea clavata]
MLAQLVDIMRSERGTTAPLSVSKHAFKRYLTSFPDGQAVVQQKKSERLKKTAQTQAKTAEYLERLKCGRELISWSPAVIKQLDDGHELQFHDTQIAKKLAGKTSFTAAWATNVGNEFGHVFASVLTAAEGNGLQQLATGLVDCYEKAGVSPPELVYTDRDCCCNFHWLTVGGRVLWSSVDSVDAKEAMALDLGHWNQFPAIVTHKYACDLRVIRLLRDKGLGNGPYRLCKTIVEEHNERYLQKSLANLTQCKSFQNASNIGLVTRPALSEPPPMATVPKFRWLLSVYCQDVLLRIDEVAKKLAGPAAKTAEWMTNVGKEHGQILVSVMTAKERNGLSKMASGIVQRYVDARVDPPVLMYVDRDCCSGKTKHLFPGWGDLLVRLDISHFIRRIVTGCSTEPHQLHKMFMIRLSQCIFHWDSQDVERLKVAKKNELEKLGMQPGREGHPS